MEFKEFRDLQQSHMKDLFEDVTTLFTVNVDKDVIWETYLNSFPPGTNEIFRQRREYDCSCCRSFIKNFGNVVVVKDGKLFSIWGFQTGDKKFQPVIDALDNLITKAQINGVFVSKETSFGTNVSRELKEGQVISWNHFFIKVPSRFVLNSGKTVGTVLGDYTSNREVLERSLQQISVDALDVVLDLISQNSLYKGEEWKGTLEKFLTLKKEYDKLTETNNWCWVKSVEVGPVISKIKNHSIGTLLLDLSEGTELEIALRKYEAVVAPTNYKRPQAVFTQKMVGQAKKTVEELGLVESLPRRFARLDDITINDVLFADRSIVTKMSGNAFDKLAKSIPDNPKNFERVEEVTIDKFVNDVLPRATAIAILVENKHIPNLVSLIAPQNTEAPTLFKWPNNFSWAYNGNIADSMKQRVAAAGGKIDGVLRFSIQWNEKGDNKNDFDAHCIEPNGNHIYFPNKRTKHPSSGMLDVDIIHPQEVAVENITWTDANRMREGVYELFVHNYSHRGGVDGFAAEIEYDNQIHQFEYRKNILQSGKVLVAKIRFNKRSGIEFIESLPSSFTPKNIWNITTNQFVPVLAVMYSPNYWGGYNVGNRHVIFALKDCINDSQPNGFFNEFLNENLMPHKRVFEALGKEMKVEPSGEQLSGLGFASTKRNSIVVKVTGNIDRIIRVVF